MSFSIKKRSAEPKPLLEGAVPGIPTDVEWVKRVGSMILLVGLGGFFLWAFLAPLDEGVPAPATVSVDTQRKSVQHLSGGIVSKILVKEAQEVKFGDILIQLDDAYVRANFEALRKQYLALRGQEGRLSAERNGASRIEFHTDLLNAAKDDPVANSYVTIETQLFHSRQSALRSELAAISESIGAVEEQLRGTQAQLKGKEVQLKLVTDQLVGTRELAKDGYLPRNKMYEEERLAADLSAGVNDLQATIGRLKRNAAELRLKSIQRQEEFKRDAEDKLADVKRDLEPVAEKYRAASVELERTVIKAPASGYIVGLQMQTVGGVIQAGQKIMDIVPDKEKLILEAQVPPQYVDRLRTGLSADIRFQAFNDLPHLVIDGRLISVSADRLVDQLSHQPYFLARIEVTPDGIKKLGKNQIQSGMGAEVVIKTGEHTFFQYLTRPLFRRVSQAFIEK